MADGLLDPAGEGVVVVVGLGPGPVGGLPAQVDQSVGTVVSERQPGAVGGLFLGQVAGGVEAIAVLTGAVAMRRPVGS